MNECGRSATKPSRILVQVRELLLQEARHSPALLSDLAGLERYVAESYHARSFVELLQNADDAGATRFLIRRNGRHLFLANDVRVFTSSDFESLCRSAASRKTRGETIGYRGIGFKSVVALANKIHLFSGSLAATFSRDLTSREIGGGLSVPLVRVPHPIPSADIDAMEPIVIELQRAGYQTIFVFDEVISHAIENEFLAFDPYATLFLRNISQVSLVSGVREAHVTAERIAHDEFITTVQLSVDGRTEGWILAEREAVSLALREESVGPVRLEEQYAVVHAFLPTLEKTGLPFKVNGDFSTDPSRARIVLDEQTEQCIERIANLYIELLNTCLHRLPDQRSERLLNCLVPFTDPRMTAIQQRGFRANLLDAIKKASGNSFMNLRYRPKWLNGADFDNWSSLNGIYVVPASMDRVDGLYGLLAFLGAKEASHEELLPALHKSTPSYQGAAEVVAFLSARPATGQLSAEQVSRRWSIWPTGGRLRSLDQAVKSGSELDGKFLDLVVEAKGSLPELQRFIGKLSGEDRATRLISKPTAEPSARNPPFQSGAPSSLGKEEQSTVSVTKWRSAEQQVLELLLKQGWKAEDVSRQNVGYDILATHENGGRMCVEVKLIAQVGQAFSLTTNEEGVARQEGKDYFVALVRQASSHLEIALTSDPVRELIFVRQCKQWAWECSTYDFKPDSVPF